jgi:hypothetical protein
MNAVLPDGGDVFSKVIVWPEELAPGLPRFPTPPWSQR